MLLVDCNDDDVSFVTVTNVNHGTDIQHGKVSPVMPIAHENAESDFTNSWDFAIMGPRITCAFVLSARTVWRPFFSCVSSLVRACDTVVAKQALGRTTLNNCNE